MSYASLLIAWISVWVCGSMVFAPLLVLPFLCRIGLIGSFFMGCALLLIGVLTDEKWEETKDGGK